MIQMIVSFIKKIIIVLLMPLSFCWSAFYQIRRFGYEYGLFIQNSFRVPIISIGNITFGGTGKTPFTLWIAQYLEERNKKVMILMRGYKGSKEKGHGIVLADDSKSHDPSKFGDEAIIFGRNLKNARVVVGRNRCANLRHYLDLESPDFILLDDGHQHLKLARNINFCLFDSTLPMESYHVAPRGYLRESFTSLRKVDAIILTRCRQVSTQKIKLLKSKISKFTDSNIPVAEIDYKTLGFFDSTPQLKLMPEEIKDKIVIAMAGIASPESFYKTLESLGARIIKKHTFPDHHNFSSKEIDLIMKESQDENAVVITTEKDIVKINKFNSCGGILYLAIAVDFLSGEQDIKSIVDKGL